MSLCRTCQETLNRHWWYFCLGGSRYIKFKQKGMYCTHLNPSSTPTWRNKSMLQLYHFLGYSSVCPADFSSLLLEQCFAIKTLPVFGNPTQIYGGLNNMSGCLTVSMVNFRPPARFYLPITAVATNPAGFFLLGPWRELKHTSALFDCTGLISFSNVQSHHTVESCVVKSDTTYENNLSELTVTDLIAEMSFFSMSSKGQKGTLWI